MLKKIYDYGKSIGIPSPGFRYLDAIVVDLSADGSELSRERRNLLLPFIGRSSGVKPRLLADNREYWLDGEKAKAHRELLDELEIEMDSEIRAVKTWLNNAVFNKDSNSVITVSIDGFLLAQDSRVQDFWLKIFFANAKQVFCTVLGEMRPQVSFVGIKVKHLVGGHMSGVYLFRNALNSRSLPTPVSTEAAEVITETINTLIMDKSHSLRLGKLIYLFFGDPDQPEAWSNLLKRGDYPTELQPGTVYAFAIKAIDQGNCAIVDQFSVSTEALLDNLEAWEIDSSCVNEYGQLLSRTDTVWWLTQAADFYDQDVISIVRAIMLGEKISDRVLLAIQKKIKEGKSIDHAQATLLTAALTRQERWKKKVGFNSQPARQGYTAGYNAARRGGEPRTDFEDPEYKQGYNQGFKTGSREESA